MPFLLEIEETERLDKSEKSKVEDAKKKRIIYRKFRLDLHEDYVNQDGQD